MKTLKRNLAGLALIVSSLFHEGDSLVNHVSSGQKGYTPPKYEQKELIGSDPFIMQNSQTGDLVNFNVKYFKTGKNRKEGKPSFCDLIEIYEVNISGVNQNPSVIVYASGRDLIAIADLYNGEQKFGHDGKFESKQIVKDGVGLNAGVIALKVCEGIAKAKYTRNGGVLLPEYKDKQTF